MAWFDGDSVQHLPLPPLLRSTFSGSALADCRKACVKFLRDVGSKEPGFRWGHACDARQQADVVATKPHQESNHMTGDSARGHPGIPAYPSLLLNVKQLLTGGRAIWSQQLSLLRIPVCFTRTCPAAHLWCLKPSRMAHALWS
jgi:hypothetical protein